LIHIIKINIFFKFLKKIIYNYIKKMPKISNMSINDILQKISKSMSILKNTNVSISVITILVLLCSEIFKNVSRVVFNIVNNILVKIILLLLAIIIIPYNIAITALLLLLIGLASSKSIVEKMGGGGGGSSMGGGGSSMGGGGSSMGGGGSSMGGSGSSMGGSGSSMGGGDSSIDDNGSSMTISDTSANNGGSNSNVKKTKSILESFTEAQSVPMGYNGPICDENNNSGEGVSTFKNELNAQGLNDPRGFSTRDYIF
jgi:hypothetical protein